MKTRIKDSNCICSGFFQRIKIIILLYLCVIAPYNIYSQEQSDIYSIPLDSLWNIKISGISRFEQSASKTSNSTIIITEQQIEDRGYQDLSDVLKDVPGIDITDNASRFGEYYTIRGIQGNERILVLIDGHKINPPTGTFLSVGNSISVRFAKRIEIIYGPASAVYGADAFSGIINIITKDSYKNNINAILGGSYASLNSKDLVFESRFKVNSNLSFTLFGRMYKSDGFDVVGTDTIYNIITRYQPPYTPKCEQPINDYSFFGRVNYKNFSLSYYRQMFDEGNGYTQNPDKNLYNKLNKWKSNSDNIWATYREEFPKLGILTIDLNAVSFKIDKNTQFAKWVIANVPDTAFSQYMTGEDLALKGSASLFKEFSNKLNLIAGLDYEHIKSIPPYANDQLFGKSYKFEGSVADSIRDLLTITDNRISGFGQITWSPWYMIDFIIGGRIDYSSQNKHTINPRVGINFHPFSRTIFRLMYGTAFQAPSMFFQYEQWGSSTHVMLSTTEVQKLVDPNWKLKNQLTDSYEMSFTQKIGKSTQIRILGYYNNLTDLIQRVTFDNSNNTYNKYYNKLTNGVRNENVGVQIIKGFNAEFNYGIDNKLESYIYYSYTKGISEETTGNVNIPRISEHKLLAGFTYRNILNIINISPRVRILGDINNLNKTMFPNGKQDGYNCIDVSISSNELFGFIKFYAQINNILNTKINHAGLYQQTGGYLPTVPQEQLRVKFGIEAKFTK